MNSDKNLIPKITLLFTFLVTSFYACGLPVFVMQAVTSYHATHGSAGALESFFNLPQVIVSFIVFSYIIKIGYRRSLTILLLFMAVFGAIIPFLNHYWAIKLYLVLAGASFVSIKITIYSAIALVADNKKSHASFMSILEGVFMGGSMIGMWIFSFFIPINWLYAFWVFAAFALFNALLWLFIRLNEKDIEKAKEQTLSESFGEITTLFKKSNVLLYILLLVVYALIEQGVFSWLPSFNNEILKLPKTLSVELGSFMIGFIAFGRILGGVILKFVKWQFVFAFNFICGIVLICVTFVFLRQGVTAVNSTGLLNLPWEAWSLPLLGFFIAPVIPILNSSILTSLPKIYHTCMITIMVVVSAVGSSFASRLVGGMFTWVGGAMAFGIITVIPLFILLIFILPYTKALLYSEKTFKDVEQ
jgi:MFS transporter, FHS family, glucose/mannose:H+ symporter